MAKFTVMPVFTAATYEEIEADTPEKAIDASESYASLCHQCGSHLEVDDVYFHIVLDEDGEEVYRDDPLDAARVELATLRAQLARYGAVVEAARAVDGCDCPDHIAPLRWCTRCATKIAVRKRLERALAALDTNKDGGDCRGAGWCVPHDTLPTSHHPDCPRFDR